MLVILELLECLWFHGINFFSKYLISHFLSTPGKITLSFNRNFGPNIAIFSPCIYFDSFIIISIVKDNVRDPNQADLILHFSQSSFIDITRTLKCSIFQNQLNSTSISVRTLRASSVFRL